MRVGRIAALLAATMTSGCGGCSVGFGVESPIAETQRGTPVSEVLKHGKPDEDRPYVKTPGHPCETEPDTARVLEYRVPAADLPAKAVRAIVGDLGVIAVCVDAKGRVLSTHLIRE